MKDIEQHNWIQIDSNGKVHIIPQELYIYLKNSLHLIVDDHENIYIYDKTHYKKLKRYELEALVKSYLPEKYRIRKQWVAVINELLTDYRIVKETDFNDNENIIAFSNGILNLNTGEMMEHDPKYLLSRIIDVPYTEESIDTPEFDKFLNSLIPYDTDAQTFIWEYIGAILSNVKGWRYKKMLLLVGKGNTGKSKLRELVTKILGLDNCMSIDLKELNSRFGTSTIYGKRLAGSGDMSYMKIQEMSTIKELTGGDMIFAERKGKDAFSFRYDGFLWSNSNSLPKFGGDKGIHLYERFNIIMCNNVIPESYRNPNLLDELYKERIGIVNKAIRYFLETRKNDYCFTESYDMRSARFQYIKENNSLYTFVEDCCSMKERVLRSTFNSKYKDYCRDNDLMAEKQREIGIQLEEKYDIHAVKIGGLYYYDGLSINPDLVPLTNEEILDQRYSEIQERITRRMNERNQYNKGGF